MTEPADTSAVSRLMAERYGVGSPCRRWVLIGSLAVGAVALLAWLAWSAWEQATGNVSGEIVAFEVVSAHQIDVTLDVHRPASAAVQCTVQAQAVDHTIVGEAHVLVPAGGGSDLQIDTSVRTDREATTARVSGCR